MSASVCGSLPRGGRLSEQLHAVLLLPAAVQVGLKCSRALSLSRHLQTCSNSREKTKAPSAAALPQQAAEMLAVVSYGSSAWAERAAPARPTAAGAPEAEQAWLDACSSLEVDCLEAVRPLVQRRLAAATVVNKEALSKCMRDFTANCLQRWNAGKGRKPLGDTTAVSAVGSE